MISMQMRLWLAGAGGKEHNGHPAISYDQCRVLRARHIMWQLLVWGWSRRVRKGEKTDPLVSFYAVTLTDNSMPFLLN